MKQLHTLRWLMSGFIILFSACFLHAQEEVTVYLHKGSVVKGKFLSYQYGDSLKLAYGPEKHLIVIPEDAIRKIKFEKAEGSSDFGEKKLIYTTRLSLLPGSTATGLGLTQMAAYRLNKTLIAGASLGVENYYVDAGFNVFPLCGFIRKYGKNKIASPYAEMKMGYGFVFSDESSGQAVAIGGLQLNPSVGLRFGSRYLYTEIFVGLKFQNLYYQYAGTDSVSEYDIQARRLETGISFTF